MPALAAARRLRGNLGNDPPSQSAKTVSIAARVS